MQLFITLFYTGSPVTSHRFVHVFSAFSQPTLLTPAVRTPSFTPMQHDSLNVPILKFNVYILIQQTENKYFLLH